MKTRLLFLFALTSFVCSSQTLAIGDSILAPSIGGVADNLGNHTATQNIGMAGFDIINSGNLVELGGSQTITGEKTFSLNPQMQQGIIFPAYSTSPNLTQDWGLLQFTVNQWIFHSDYTFSFSFMGLSGDRQYQVPDKNGDLALISDITDALQGTSQVSNILDCDNVNGRFGGVGVPNGNSTYTTAGTVVGGWCKVKINTTVEPTVTGGTKVKGADFIPDTDMYLICSYNGADYEYFFLEL